MSKHRGGEPGPNEPLTHAEDRIFGPVDQEQCAVKRPHPAHQWNLPGDSEAILWCNGVKACGWSDAEGHTHMILRSGKCSICGEQVHGEGREAI